MLTNRHDIDFNQYEKIITKYIETGTIPPEITKEILLSKLSSLNRVEKDSLRGSIEMELPMDEWAHLGPWLENVPKAAKWAGLVGLASGVADYKVSNNFYSATKTGLLTSTATFFGQQAYKSYQIKDMWNHRQRRANEFLDHLPERSHDNQLFNSIR